MKSLKYISWNVNGLRACMKKGFMQSFKELDADCFCLQETKLQPDQIELDLPGYYQYWNSAVKKGYSGTALFTKIKPLSVTYGIGMEEHDQEGRVITADFNDHCLVTCYTPNSQRGLARLTYRMKWEDDFKKYLHGMGRCFPRLSSSARQQKAGHSLRRFECGPRGDRPCQSGIKSYERRFY